MDVYQLLLTLEELWPAPEPRQHAVFLRRDGEPGLEVILQHPKAERPTPLLFDEADMKKSIVEITTEINGLLKELGLEE